MPNGEKRRLDEDMTNPNTIKNVRKRRLHLPQSYSDAREKVFVDKLSNLPFYFSDSERLPHTT